MGDALAMVCRHWGRAFAMHDHLLHQQGEKHKREALPIIKSIELKKSYIRRRNVPMTSPLASPGPNSFSLKGQFSVSDCGKSYALGFGG